MLSSSLLGAIKRAQGNLPTLRAVPREEQRDRSAPVVDPKSPVVDEEATRSYFFRSGAESWHHHIASKTFSSIFCDINPEEATIIVQHWKDQEAWRNQNSGDHDPFLLQSAVEKLCALRERLDEVVRKECQKSPVGRAFVKLSTRSPKDSRKILTLASEAYQRRIATMTATEATDPNIKWRILSEEVANASAVKDGAAGLELLLDSARVFEDLDYALQPRGDESSTPPSWNVSMVARSWDPRIRPDAEFRGICWNGKLTCLSQYFHPLYFPELVHHKKTEIERDVLACVQEDDVQRAIAKLGGHCIVDFARLGPGEVMIIELNPFDGIALGTFPASTGLFLWDDPMDHKIMTGEAPFEFRTRTEPMEEHKLKVDFNKAWRAIIYEELAGGGGEKQVNELS